MYPLIKAVDRWTKSRNKNIVKDIDFEYGETSKYFFGNKLKSDVFSKNLIINGRHYCYECGKEIVQGHYCDSCTEKLIQQHKKESK